MKHLFIIITLLTLPLSLFPQDSSERFLQNDCQRYCQIFDQAYKVYPQVPRGLLEAVAFTNTHCHHLTDADYGPDDAESMPRAYGLMGLVADGKQYFRENLTLVAQLSAMDAETIKTQPKTNVLAYAAAFAHLMQGDKMEEYLSVVQQLSELPMGDVKDTFPMQTMLYAVCDFLCDAHQAQRWGFLKYDIDMKSVFGDALPLLSSKRLVVSGDTDYPKALWRPADTSNFSERTEPVNGVVVHYTEGSYAGCISWFQNPASNVSAHYVIRSSDGQVTQMVREADKAWHARSANAYTIGIEHEAYGDIISYFTPEMYASSADLVRDICSRYDNIDGHHTFYRDTLDNGTCLNVGLHDLGGATACTQIRGHQHYPNQSHTDPGPFWDWNYYYKLINADVEVAVLEGEQGTLNHENYANDERKIWLIRGPENSTIELNFSSFGLEKDYDFLWIYDGDNVFAPKLGRWNRHRPATVRASGNVLCVEFRSDCATSADGWKATWKVLKPEPPAPELGYGVFPNPASDAIVIRVEDVGFVDAVIYDVYGNQVVPLTRFIGETRIDISSLSAGVYVVHYGLAFALDRTFKFVKMQ